MSENRPQSFLRWAGSKRQLLPALSKYWADGYTRYVEPFAGSACLFFRLQPQRAILGDINADLIATYRQIRTDVEGVIVCLQSLEKGRTRYMELREADPYSLTPNARAARFIYLNRYCFNGLYRTNRAGRFNVPYGGDKSGSLPSDTVLETCSVLLNRAELTQGDFEYVLQKVRPGDFVYMDPPFSTKARRVFNEYDPAIFGAVDLARLRGWMETLDNCGIPFLVSYASCEEADMLREDFSCELVSVKRNIAGFTGSRGLSEEVLISNRRPFLE